MSYHFLLTDLFVLKGPVDFWCTSLGIVQITQHIVAPPSCSWLLGCPNKIMDGNRPLFYIYMEIT
jgi:hypothetical protein